MAEDTEYRAGMRPRPGHVTQQAGAAATQVMGRGSWSHALAWTQGQHGALNPGRMGVGGVSCGS